MQLKKYIHLLLLVIIHLITSNLNAQGCTLDALIQDLDKGTPEFKNFINNNDNALDIYDDLYKNGSKYVLTNPKYLKILDGLTPEVRKYIVAFTDDKAGSTLTKFLDDCDDINFRNYINNPENILEVKGFLAHKDGILSVNEKEILAEMLEANEIANDKVVAWLKRGENMAAFRESREAGNAWGKLMKEQLSNQNSAAYKELSRNIPEFETYSIYHQVQFCLKSDCISQGNYWIPDFVLVREVQNPVTGIKHLETIIVDAKLSASTGWTKNQTAAQKMSGWKVKSVPSDPIIGNKLTDFGKNVAVNNKQSFLKLYKNDNIAKVL